MFAIEDEKLPPPTPALPAHASSTQTCVSCGRPASHPLGTTSASRVVGISSSATVTVVHARPPNFGTANVYGIRSAAPTRFGTAMSQNCSGSESAIPALPRLMTMIVQRTQTLKPRCSAKIDKPRFLRAIGRPVVFHNTGSRALRSRRGDPR